MTDRFDTLDPGFPWRSDAVAWPVMTDVGRGLSGVVAGTTRVVWLDPSSGLLAYRGVPVEDLALGSDFEEVAHLLVTGLRTEDDPDGFAEFRRLLRTSRRLPADVVGLLEDMAPDTHPTRMLRAGVAALGCHEMSVADDLAGDTHWQAMRILGQVVGLVGAVAQRRRGQPAVPPDDDVSLADGVAASLLGRAPAPHEVRSLDLVWVMYAAHGMDAPTFTSMIVASCLADPYANLVAGLSALRGSRYGGAAEQVVVQLESLGSAAEAEAWAAEVITSGGRIAGFGHRSLSMPDPRVAVLRKAFASLARRAARHELVGTVRSVEDAATRLLAPKGVHVNLNLYGAPMFRLLGAEPPEIPNLVAAARTAGMVAMVREALDTIRLFRPLTRYVGPPERRLGPRGRDR